MEGGIRREREIKRGREGEERGTHIQRHNIFVRLVPNFWL